jgi:hypothetical protein
MTERKYQKVKMRKKTAYAKRIGCVLQSREGKSDMIMAGERSRDLALKGQLKIWGVRASLVFCAHIAAGHTESAPVSLCWVPGTENADLDCS